MLTAVLGLSISMAASGAEDEKQIWVNAGFYSAHFDTDRGVRNANPGLGIEVPLAESWSLTAGHFVNSDSATSNYLGAYDCPTLGSQFILGAIHSTDSFGAYTSEFCRSQSQGLRTYEFDYFGWWLANALIESE